MKVRTKLIIGFSVMAVLIWISAIIAVNNFGNLNTHFVTVEEEIIPNTVAMNELETLSSDIYRGAMDYLFHDNIEDKQTTLSMLSRLKEIGMQYLPTLVTEESLNHEKDVVLASKIFDFYYSVSWVIHMKETGYDSEKYQNRYFGASLPALLALQQHTSEIKAVNIGRFEKVESAFSKTSSSGVDSLYHGAALITFLAILAALITIRSIVQPLSTLRKGTELIARGNLTYKTDTGRGDEFGQLSRAFDRMTRSLSTSMTSIDNLNKEIADRKLAEEALQESEEKFSKAFRSSPNSIAITTMEDGVFLEVNDSFTRDIGYTREEVIGRSSKDLNLWAYPEERERILKKLRENGQVLNEEYTVRIKSGEMRNMTFSAEPINIGGKLCLIAATADITERKKAEQLQRDENYVLTLLGQGVELKEILDAIVKLGEAHDPVIKGLVFLYDKSKGFLLQASAPSLPAEYTNVFKLGVPIGPNFGSCGTAAYRKERVIVPDIKNSPLFKPYPEVAKKATKNNLFAVWSQPIIASNGEILGTIANYSGKVGEPNENDLRVLEWSAHIAAIAIERKQAEEALRESEERFSKAFRSSPETIAITTLKDGKFLEVNDSFTRMTGYTREEVIGHTSKELRLWVEDDERLRMLEILKKEGSVYNEEFDFRIKSGEIRNWLFSAEKMYIHGEECLISITTDITERKKAEEAFTNEATRRQILLDQSRDGIVVLDDNGKVYEANQRFAEMLGYSIEEVQQLGVWDWEAYLPREQVAEMIRTVDESGDHFETKHVRKDGSIYDVEISTNAAIFQEHKLIFCVCRDITARKLAEEAIKESEEFSTSLLENSPNPILVVNPDTSIRYVNPAFKKLTGYTKAKVIGIKAPYPWWPAEAQDKISSGFKDTLKGRGRNIEQVFQKKNGERFWVAITAASVIKEGILKYLLINWVDITERKRVESELKANEERFRLIADYSTDLVSRIQVTPTIKTDYVSPSCGRITGYKPEEFYKDPELGLYMVHPDDKQLFIEGVTPTKKNGSKPITFRLVRKDGKVIWVEQTQVTIFNENGEPVAIHLVARDITERREAEEALRESEERYRDLFDNARELIQSVAPDGSFVYVNRAWKNLLGYTDKEIAKLQVWDIINPDALPHCQEAFQKLMSGESIDSIETTFVAKNGRLIEVEGDVTAQLAEGKVIATRGIFRDITERKEAEEALRLSEEKFSKAFRSSPLQIALTRASDGQILDINESYCRVTGFTREETIGRSAFDLGVWLNPEDSKRLAGILLKKGRIYNEEFQFRKKSGELITQLVSAEILDIGGEKCLLSILTDITERKQAEEQLRLLGSITQQVSDATTVFSLDKKIIYMNRAAQELFGYSAEEILGKHMNTLNAKPVSKKIFDEILRPVKAGKRWTGITLKKRKDGTTFQCECYISPLYDEVGKITSYIDVQHDVTEKLKIEEALRFSDAAFKSIHDSVIAVDTDLTITHWNKISEQMYGIKASEAIGKKFTDIIEVVEEHPGQMEERLKILKKQGYHREEQRYRTPNGELWADVHVQEIVGNGKHYGRVVLSTDITKRKKMEEALKESEAKFYTAFHASPEAITLVNIDDGKFIEVNESYTRMTGYSRDEVLGHNADEFNMWVDNEQRDTMINKINNNIKLHNEELRFRTKPGEIRTHLFSTEYVRISGKLCLLTVSTDITERKRAEEELKQAGDRLAATNKELEAFSYSVSHDLRSPLRSIDGFSQALIEDYNDTLDDAGKNYLQRLRGASQKMGELIDGLLKLSRLTRSEMHFENVDLSKLVQEITARLQETQPERKAKFIINKGLTANGDPQLLRVLFENLLSNAWKFSRNASPAKIEFGIAENGEKPTYYIKDNGAGFDMHFADKLFGAFQRLHDSKEFPGTGIGLATVQRIINRHGGSIWAESAVGKGAIFYFTLN